MARLGGFGLWVILSATRLTGKCGGRGRSEIRAACRATKPGYQDEGGIYFVFLGFGELVNCDYRSGSQFLRRSAR